MKKKHRKLRERNHSIKLKLYIFDFQFKQCQELLKECKGSFADEVIEERRLS